MSRPAHVKLSLDRDEAGEITGANIVLHDVPVHGTRILATSGKDKNKVVVQVDWDARANVIGIRIDGLIKLVERRPDQGPLKIVERRPIPHVGQQPEAT
jgi:hypothetical protein